MGASVDKIEEKDITFHERIGEGGFGAVKRVTFKKPYKGYKEAAAKGVIFDLGQKEVEVMSKLRHPNIVTLLGVCQTGVAGLILMEYAPNGSLHYYLKDKTRPLPYSLQRKWAAESARALQYLHQENYLHRDIKPQNCLLFENNVLKLCDFGLSREIEESQTTSSQKGTYRYMAPEIHVGNKRGRGIYSKPSDIWSYGMLLLEICTRKPPFEELEWHRVVFEVGSGTKPSIPGYCPKDLSDIMQRCWESDPKQRISIDDIVTELYSVGKMEIRREHRRSSSAIAPVSRVACCPNGDVVVYARKDVYLCSSDGKMKRKLHSSEGTTERKGVPSFCVSPLGYILIVDGKGYVEVFTLKGDYLQGFSSSQSGHLDGCVTKCYVIDREGNLLVCSQSNAGCIITVHECTDGTLIRKFEYKQRSFAVIEGITVNSKNQILIHSWPKGSSDERSTNEASNNTVVAIDYSGNEVFSFTPKIDQKPRRTQLWTTGIMCDESDNIYIAMKVSTMNNSGHVHAYSPTGDFLRCMVKGLYDPHDLCRTLFEQVLIADWENVAVLTPGLNST